MPKPLRAACREHGFLEGWTKLSQAFPMPDFCGQNPARTQSLLKYKLQTGLKGGPCVLEISVAEEWLVKSSGSKPRLLPPLHLNHPPTFLPACCLPEHT